MARSRLISDDQLRLRQTLVFRDMMMVVNDGGGGRRQGRQLAPEIPAAAVTVVVTRFPVTARVVIMYWLGSDFGCLRVRMRLRIGVSGQTRLTRSTPESTRVNRRSTVSQHVNSWSTPVKHHLGSVLSMRFTFGLVSIHLKFVRFDRFGFNSKRVRKSTKVNSGQPVNCRVNWSSARRVAR
ncbi:uncharacterized protein LOC110891858 isoform X2 [Helianthus annuus]|uniref:uncharacterized protein LOC110891858 isoform X2 n=1 Tax=Helianthus annuus TaxID=4232 RepID=UPI0016532997|nr:uncharacterized protein LOC110891858 isoform X2 [Helianthus annuus]